VNSSSRELRLPIRLLVFAVVTGLTLAGGVVPFHPSLGGGGEPRRLFVGALEAFWWLGAAWLAVGFLRAFVVLGRQPRESKLIQDLLAALIYLGAAFAIIAEVFDLPVKGLLATSGAVAIILGLALQSSLGDVFSGIVLNIERPYRVLGFYSLAAGAVAHDEATDRVRKGQARHSIPVILLARLAVDLSMQERGLGPALLKDALLRAAQAADTIGARAVLVHAKDDDAKGFYAHFDFEPSPSDPYHLLLIMRDVLKNIGRFGT
jgi:GNAT superfamily N-acetyltransferase